MPVLNAAAALRIGSSAAAKAYAGAAAVWLPPAPVGTPPAFRSASYGRTASGTTVAVPTPAGVVNGDVLVAFIGLRPTRGISAAPAGWTERFVSVGAGSAPGIGCYTKTASSEGASHTWTTTAADTITGSIAAYSGAAVGAAGTPGVNFSNNPTINGITSPAANSLWVAAVIAGWQDYTVSNGAAGGWTSRQASTAATHLWQRVSDKVVAAGVQAADPSSFDLLNSGLAVISDYWITGSVVLVPA